MGRQKQATLKRELVLATVNIALIHQQSDGGVLHHSDWKSQYALADYWALLKVHAL